MSLESSISELAAAISALAKAMTEGPTRRPLVSPDHSNAEPASAPAPVAPVRAVRKDEADAPAEVETKTEVRRPRGRPRKTTVAAVEQSEAAEAEGDDEAPEVAVEVSAPAPTADEVDAAAERLFEQFGDDESEAPAPSNVVNLKPATLDDCRFALTDVSNVISRDRAIALLKSFGASKLGELKPEKFDDLVAHARELVEQARGAA